MDRRRAQINRKKRSSFTEIRSSSMQIRSSITPMGSSSIPKGQIYRPPTIGNHPFSLLVYLSLISVCPFSAFFYLFSEYFCPSLLCVDLILLIVDLISLDFDLIFLDVDLISLYVDLFLLMVVHHDASFAPGPGQFCHQKAAHQDARDFLIIKPLGEPLCLGAFVAFFMTGVMEVKNA